MQGNCATPSEPSLPFPGSLISKDRKHASQAPTASATPRGLARRLLLKQVAHADQRKNNGGPDKASLQRSSSPLAPSGCFDVRSNELGRSS